MKRPAALALDLEKNTRGGGGRIEKASDAPCRLTSCDDSRADPAADGSAILAVTCDAKCRCAALACSSCAARACASACCCVRRCCSSCCAAAAPAPRPPPLAEAAPGSPAPPRPRGTGGAEAAAGAPPSELAGRLPDRTSLSLCSCSRSSAAPGAAPEAAPRRAFCTSPSAALNIPSPSLALARLASAARFPGLDSRAESHSERASLSLDGKSMKHPARATRRSEISAEAEEGAALMAAS